MRCDLFIYLFVNSILRIFKLFTKTFFYCYNLNCPSGKSRQLKSFNSVILWLRSTKVEQSVVCLAVAPWEQSVFLNHTKQLQHLLKSLPCFTPPSLAHLFGSPLEAGRKTFFYERYHELVSFQFPCRRRCC